MSSASTQKSKRRRIVESDAMRQSQQQQFAQQLQQSMARSQEHASNHLVRSAESQMRVADIHGQTELQQVHHSIQHLTSAHLTSNQISSGQFHIQGAPHAVRMIDPSYSFESRKHNLRSAPPTKSSQMSSNSVHIAGAKAQQTHEKKRQKDHAQGRNISRLPG